MSKLENLEPERVFHFFEEIASIPRGSYHTKSISNYLANFAKSRGLEYYQDDTDNVVIIKEAAEGYGFVCGGGFFKGERNYLRGR